MKRIGLKGVTSAPNPHEERARPISNKMLVEAVWLEERWRWGNKALVWCPCYTLCILYELNSELCFFTLILEYFESDVVFVGNLSSAIE